MVSHTVPTDAPESDGTFEWDSTTIVLVDIEAAGAHGLGYTYADGSLASLILTRLAPVLENVDPLDIGGAWARMQRAVRNNGPMGLAQYAISAVDIALWDLKAKLVGLPLATLLGRVRQSAPAYASGGFTSLSTRELQDQLAGFAERGFRRLKMKVGRDPAADPVRVASARAAVGPAPELYVDANGAYDRRQALALAERFHAHGVRWFEEPVSSDDLAGLRALKAGVPADMEVAAGEYATTVFEHERLASAVDVLQPDVTRCGGVTGTLMLDGLARARGVGLSAHCAPQVAAHVWCALHSGVHVEWFHDHARVERLLFDGALEPREGRLEPTDRPGLGIELRPAEAWRWAA